MEKKLLYFPDRCSGCRSCELACTFRNHGSYGRVGSLIRIVCDDKELRNFALFCHHCERPICVDLCPVDAIVKDEKTGMIMIDDGKCIGCGTCAACPLGGICMNADSGIAQVCNLCGGKPECVGYCPRGALVYVMSSEARFSELL